MQSIDWPEDMREEVAECDVCHGERRYGSSIYLLMQNGTCTKACSLECLKLDIERRLADA